MLFSFLYMTHAIDIVSKQGPSKATTTHTDQLLVSVNQLVYLITLELLFVQPSHEELIEKSFGWSFCGMLIYKLNYIMMNILGLKGF